MDDNQKNKINKVRYSTIIDGAYGLVIAQNIFCFSRPIISYCYGNINASFFCAFILIAILNFANLIANWISSRSTTENYSNRLLVLDVLSLIIIAVFTQLITDSFDSQNNYTFILRDFFNTKSLFAIFYCLLYLSFLVWNVLADESIEGLNRTKKRHRFFNGGNIIILIYCMVLVSVSVFEFSHFSAVANILFWVAIAFSFIIIIRYYITTIFVNNYSKIKLKATWTGGRKKVTKQYLVSLKSYLVYPFSCKEKTATKKFFKQIYNSAKIDDLIFDGNDNSYLDKVASIIDGCEYDVIYDCGCGAASFYNYLNKVNIKFKKYIGVDFAVEPKLISQNAEVLNDDIVSHDYAVEGKTLFVFCNVLCYLSKDDITALLNGIAHSNVDILIIDPIPSLFWDATFDNVKLHYRSIKKVNKLMAKFGFKNSMIVKDYLWRIGKLYLRSLSYATLYSM